MLEIVPQVGSPFGKLAFSMTLTTLTIYICIAKLPSCLAGFLGPGTPGGTFRGD